MANTLSLTRIVTLSICSALLQGTPASLAEKPESIYANCDFGYVVRIPTRLAASVSTRSRHGFRINLPDGKSVIEVYNAFNMSESTAFADIVKYELELKGQGRAEWKVMNKSVGKTGGLDSAEITASYTRKTGAWKAKVVIVYRPTQTNGLGNIAYVLELSSPDALYESALADFHQTVDGFQLTDLPRGPCK